MALTLTTPNTVLGVLSPKSQSARLVTNLVLSLIHISMCIRDRLERVETLKTSFGEDEPVNRPPPWSGFRIIPQAMEFWKDGANRLHDRVRFTRTLPDGAWTRQRLYP